MAALIRTKQLSSREVVQAHLDRVAAVNPKINAVVTLMADDALKNANAADKLVASGAVLGPLHGVPFSIKDSLDTAGVLTKRGSKLFAGNIPDKDATSVERFKTAGGIPPDEDQRSRVFLLDGDGQSRDRAHQQSLGISNVPRVDPPAENPRRLRQACRPSALVVMWPSHCVDPLRSRASPH